MREGRDGRSHNKVAGCSLRLADTLPNIRMSGKDLLSKDFLCTDYLILLR